MNGPDEALPTARQPGIADGTVEACRVLLAVLDGGPGPVLVRPVTLHALCLTAIEAARAVILVNGGGDGEADAFARAWLAALRDGAVLRALDESTGGADG